MASRRRRVAVPALLLLIMLAAACSAAPAGRPPPQAVAAPAESLATPAPSAGLTPLTLVYSTSSAGNSLLQLAQDRGLFRANGLAVDLVQAPGNAGPAALLAGHWSSWRRSI